MKKLLLLPTLCVLIMSSQTRCVKQNTLHTTDTVTVHDTATRTLIVQPGPDDGQDVSVFNAPPGINTNQKQDPDFLAGSWTDYAQGWGQGNTRSYIEFVALDGLPDSAVIKSARLYLYGFDVNKASAIVQGNSDYPGSPYGNLGNACWLKRVLGNWNLDSITWNNMPPTTDIDEAMIPASTSQWNNNDTVDVTKLVQDIVNSGQNYGFCMQLQTEQIYRDLAFAGSRNADSTRRPKLEVTWSIH
ncbi:DNRLRE domain-containing protein [Dinghuibacter silviterrae]|uniref:Carbohydrate-binding module family 96 domain-containing protein n=1 Tax=Dinghuibacter silviterrae TaxID=1539049 RepID=A0A4R8DNB2_9BACT|nr:DNRLRE domain-containing protein [Dinghuibacter silviterrae]TDW99187.1 hypothetical protein EDB95_0196 [Dinghuibacter silviterrae]